jgi:tetratricopeptide (TPR) repeat protein
MDLKRIITVVFILAIVVNNIIFSLIRMPVWHDEEIFFNTMVAQNPKSSLAHHNLGHYYYRKGEWQQAEEEYKKSIFINPSFPAPHASLGDIYTRTGRYQEAIEEYNIYQQFLPSAPNRTATIYRIKQLQNLLGKP